MKYHFFRILCAVVLGFIFSPSTAFANLIVVNTTLQKPGGSPDCTLGEAIDAANTDAAVDGCAAGSGGDTILLLNNNFVLAVVDNGANGLPIITSPIVINGFSPGGSTITVTTSIRFIEVGTNGQLTLNHITLVDGGYGGFGGNGGAILMDNNSGLNLNNCVIKTSTAKDGGAIYLSSGSTANFEDAEFDSNAALHGGALYNEGGTANFNGGSIHDHINASFGGAIVNVGTPTGIVNMNFVQIKDNNAALMGGAIYNGASLNIKGCTFENNTLNVSNIGGGALFNDANGNAQIDGVSNSSGDFVKTIFLNNTGNNGGAIENDGGIVVVDRSEFIGNQSVSGTSTGRGGAIFNNVGGEVTVARTFFEGNEADLFGGAYYNQGDLAVANSTFEGNTATSGSAIYNTGALAVGTILNSTFSANDGGVSGVSVLNNGGAIEVSNCTFNGNIGGALSNGVAFSTMNVRNSLIANSASDNCSGAPSSKGYNISTDASCGFIATGDHQSMAITLGALGDNGGDTPTHALPAGSPAIDAGNPAGCRQIELGPLIIVDQRGFFRPVDGDNNGSTICDVGAFEFNPTCGNGVVDSGEQCDDDNDINGDGCTFSCTIETGYACSGSPSVCTVDCGNGVILGSEQCDDDNNVSGDGCSKFCAIETGYTCSGAPSVCGTVCGDGVVAGTEQCDDGNNNNLDGCSFQCAIEAGFACTGSPSVCTPGCGDGSVDGSEQCDDDNLNNDDGCSSTCAIEPGFTCAGSPSTCNQAGANTNEGGGGCGLATGSPENTALGVFLSFLLLLGVPMIFRWVRRDL